MNTYPAKAGRPQPRFNAQMEGTVLPLFSTSKPHAHVYFEGHDIWMIIQPKEIEAIRDLCFKTRADLARIVAESRRK